MNNDVQKVEVDLRGDGLLWLINRSLLHPRGFALAMGEDGRFYLWGNGDEPWRFEDVDEDEAFRSTEAVMAKVRRPLTDEARDDVGEGLSDS